MLLTLSRNAPAQEIAVWKPANLKTFIDTAKGPVILNFWATFCKPCVAEMPHFEALAGAYKSSGVQLIFVSLDLKESFPQGVKAFVRSRKLASPVVFLNESNADVFVPLVDSAWSGAIPASLFLNKSRKYRKFIEEELSREELETEIRKMLN